MQKNGDFVSSVMGDGRARGWAHELHGILSIDMVRKSGELKRKRDSGVADVSENETSTNAVGIPQLELPDDEAFGAFGDEDAAGADTTDRARSEIHLPADDGFLPPDEYTGIAPHGDREEDLDPARDQFEETTEPLLHPSEQGAISQGTKHAVHLLRERFGSSADGSPSRQKRAHIMFQDLLPERTTSKAEATKMFFEVLVLATKDAVKVEQAHDEVGTAIRVIAHELSHALNTLRLSNVYDLSSVDVAQRIFLLKFAKPDQRQSLVIDSGFRCHLTNFTRATAAAPSAFVTRLRRFLRSRRVTSVSQVGTDRILEIQFSDGQYRLLLEFYAGGNIVLTGADLSILALLRSVPEGPDQEELRVGLKYSLEKRQNYHGVPSLAIERLRYGLRKALERYDENVTTNRKKLRKRPGNALRKAIATSLTEFPPVLIDHALCVIGFDPDIQVEAVIEDNSALEKVMQAMKEASKIIASITSSQHCKGYIIAKLAKYTSFNPLADNSACEAGQQGSYMYEDFHPFRPRQCEGRPEITIVEFDGFNETVDKFFSSLESQRLETRLADREENARQKLETAKLDHENRIGGLQQVQELNVRKAQVIEANLQRTHEAIAAVNSLLAQGMDWQNVARLIEVEKERHNVVAEMIKVPLKLYENKITLLLAEESYEEEADFEGNETDSDVSDSGEDSKDAVKSARKSTVIDNRLEIDVDLALSPWSNARQYYHQKKSAAVKEQKTLQSSEKALKSTERKITADLKKGLKQEKEIMRPQRKAFWFEKFLYFISSESYLVLSGKDAQQNEILYKRFLKQGDVYIHADLQGAASVIVKNKPGRAHDPLPPSTLSQAGILAVAASTAWDSKAVMSAWWVYAEQVSKIASTGDYLQTGNFHISGQKNFLPPAQLLLGFGLMFKISEESEARHLRHRIQENPPGEMTENVAVIEDGMRHSEPAGRPVEAVTNEADNDSNHVLEEGSDGSTGTSEAQIEELSIKHGNDDDEGQSDYDFTNPLQPDLRQSSITATGQDQETEADNDSGDDRESLEAKSIDHGIRVGAITELSEGRSVRHLSAKERRLKKQYHRASSSGPARRASLGTEFKKITLSSTPASSALSKSSETHKSAQQMPHVRGKHGKLNRIKTKYANQDEEDRALAMRLLGSASAQGKAKEDAAVKEAKEQELAAQKERRRRQHALAAERGKEEEERRKWEFEQGAGKSGEEEKDVETLENLDSFVGAPLPGDDILDALVVCGPWDAIGSRCRWRAKLQPGTTKKGKAVREILGKWNQMVTEGEKKRLGSVEGKEPINEEEKIRRREGELIRAIREGEVVGVVPVGKVRVVMGSGAKGEIGRGARADKGEKGGKGSKKRR
ncbi:MAG: hypothetical protein Q9217_006571 [Psora testacea]